jgi:hypothetical protein
MDEQLWDIYCTEMTERVERLRLTVPRCASADAASRSTALYDAHLQAHTIKGTSQQLGLREAAALGAAMSSALEQAREDGILANVVRENVERGCKAMLVWLNDTDAKRGLTVAAAAFALPPKVRQ